MVSGEVAQAGGVRLRLLGDGPGLTGQLSRALARRSSTPSMTAAGPGRCRGGDRRWRRGRRYQGSTHQQAVLGSVASQATVWRALDEINLGAAIACGRGVEYSVGYAVTEKIRDRSRPSPRECGHPRPMPAAGCTKVVTLPSSSGCSVIKGWTMHGALTARKPRMTAYGRARGSACPE